MSKFAIFFVLFCTFCFTGYSQSNNPVEVFINEQLPDSTRFKAATDLRKKYMGLTADSLLWQAAVIQKMIDKGSSANWTGLRYLTLSRYYMVKGKTDSAQIVCDLGISWMESKPGDANIMSNLLFTRGRLEMTLGRYGTAKPYFVRARSYLNPEKDFEGMGKNYMTEGAVDFELGNYLPSLYAMQKAQKFAEKANDTQVLALTQLNIGLAFGELGIKEESRKELIKAAEIYQKLGDPHSLAVANTFLISTAQSEEEARRYFNTGKSIVTPAQMLEMESNLHYNMGLFFDTKEMPDSALFHLKISQKIAEQCKSEIQITSAQTQAGFIMVQNGQPEAGLQLLEAALPSVLAQNNSKNLFVVYAGLSKGYKHRGDLARALDYLEKSVEIRDSINSKDISSEVIRQYLDNLYEKEKEQIAAQNALSQLETATELRQQRLLSGSLGIFLLLLSALAYVFFKNMKERKTAAEQLQVLNDRLQSESEQLKKSNQMLHGFALSVSHDILNNIDLILSNGNVLVGSAPSPNNLTLYYEQTQRIGYQLKDYCTSLLDSARNYHKQQSHPSSNDPNPIVQQILERFGPLLKEKNFEVQFEPLSPTGLPLAVVSQVFQNLVSNSIRYASDQAMPVLRIATETRHSKSFWVIEDNGPGIAEEQLDSILTNPTSSSKGHGIGLIQVKSILSKFKSNISVMRSPLGGARFEIHF
jgi:signal transduction histidine kinase